MSKHRTVGVLAGGDSPEREVSLVSGRCVHEALVAMGRTARLVQIETLDDLVPQLPGIDVVFSCLHGGAGEDGTVQLLLDVLEIPYAGSKAQACARAMDKTMSRSLFSMQQIPIPRGDVYAGEDVGEFVRRAEAEVGFPMVVKPASGGSTLGVFIVDSPGELRSAIEEILKTYSGVVVEEYIAGRELTVGVLLVDGIEIALPVIEIVIPGRLFDYEAKYTEGVAEFLVPAPLDEESARRARDASLKAHQAIGCSGFSRVDLRLAEDGVPYVIEVNTLPGMTTMSDLPRSAAAAGIDYGQLVELMLATAIREEEK
jgi:D-alanine-D-alanine ligase